MASTAYSFSDYLEALGDDWWQADPLLRRWCSGEAGNEDARKWLARLGTEVAGPGRRRAELVERPENLPRIALRGPYNDDEQEIWLPTATRDALAAAHGSGLWSSKLSERARYAAVYLMNQNGEAGITCSLACTDGLARVLRSHPEDPRSQAVIDALETATPQRWIHGAQFVTEIQGGSDAATNEVRAEPSAASDGATPSLYRLSGRKWFCSNLTADYWLVTARFPDGPADHRGVGLFCVPRCIDGRPNGHRILRLKDKLGTRALPTAELELEAAQGWAVGPLSSGLRTMVSVVLTTSRIHNVVAAAAFIRAAEREARAYAGFRRAFGQTLREHPLLGQSLDSLAAVADRAAAGAFACVDAWSFALAHPNDDEANAWARILVSLAKAIGTRQAPGAIYTAMMVFGGNGIEERFCSLPRLWRDSAILETWEGPYTLLLMNALRDLVRLGVKGREHRFLELGLGATPDSPSVGQLAQILANPDAPEMILAWGELAPKLYASFEAAALERLNRAG